MPIVFLTELMNVCFSCIDLIIAIDLPTICVRVHRFVSVVSAKQQCMRNELILFSTIELRRNFKDGCSDNEEGVSKFAQSVCNFALYIGRVCGRTQRKLAALMRGILVFCRQLRTACGQHTAVAVYWDVWVCVL
jgi:hypothetical protein